MADSYKIERGEDLLDVILRESSSNSSAEKVDITSGTTGGSFGSLNVGRRFPSGVGSTI